MGGLQPADEDAQVAPMLDALVADELSLLDLVQVSAELVVRLRPLASGLGLIRPRGEMGL